MNIPCFRCGKGIPSPDNFNADYIMASDTIENEARHVLKALKHTPETLAKQTKKEAILDEEYETVILPDFDSAKAAVEIGNDLVKVVPGIATVPIQKTGIICPDCYKPEDFVIWGVHK